MLLQSSIRFETRNKFQNTNEAVLEYVARDPNRLL